MTVESDDLDEALAELGALAIGLSEELDIDFEEFLELMEALAEDKSRESE